LAEQSKIRSGLSTADTNVLAGGGSEKKGAKGPAASSGDDDTPEGQTAPVEGVPHDEL